METTAPPPESSRWAPLFFTIWTGQAIYLFGSQLAWLESILGVGVIASGITLSIWGGFKRRILTSMLGLMGVGLGSLLVGFTPATAYPLALAATFVTGFSMPITNGPLLAAVQAVVAPDMQGRVFTLIGSTSAAMSPLGLIIAAPADPSTRVTRPADTTIDDD